MSPWTVRAVRVIVTVIVLVAVALGIAAARWRATTTHYRTRLLAGASEPAVRTFSPDELSSVPPPVRRYLETVIPAGQPIITRARIEWEGEFNLGQPGADRWAPLTAVQDVVPGAPGMVWDARMAMWPGITVRVRDAFVDGRGSMRGAVLAAVSVVHRSDTPELATASLQRYLAEATWFPTALLPSQGVQWTSLGPDRALATLAAAGTTVAVEFQFGADGLPAVVSVPDRLYDDGRTPPSRQRWQGRNLRFTIRDGMQVPDDAVAEWLLPGGTYAYWRARPTEVAFEFATP